jgi:hypothetical protein
MKTRFTVRGFDLDITTRSVPEPEDLEVIRNSYLKTRFPIEGPTPFMEQGHQAASRKSCR